MADGFFTQAVSHALDRYTQRKMSEEQLKQQREISDAELKEKYYYADIVRTDNAEKNRIDEEKVTELRAQRAFEQESVPFRDLPGDMPDYIMRAFSPDGKTMRRADVGHALTAYNQWLAATRENQVESWRLGLFKKQEADAAQARQNLYALLGSAREGAPGDIPTPADMVKKRNLDEFTRHKVMADVASQVTPGSSWWGNVPGASGLIASITNAASARSTGELLPEERQTYTDALGGLQKQMKNVNTMLDLFSDPRVNADIAPEMVGVLSRVKDRYDATMPTLSRFADTAMKNTLDGYAKRINDVISAKQFPDLWKMELATADDRIRAEAQLKRQELANKGKR